MPHFISNTPDEAIGKIVGVEAIVGIAIGVGTDDVLAERSIWGITGARLVGVATS